MMPTEPGWWWYKPTIGDPEIAIVRASPGYYGCPKGELVAFKMFSIFHEKLDHVGFGQWLGKAEPPQ